MPQLPPILLTDDIGGQRTALALIELHAAGVVAGQVLATAQVAALGVVALAIFRVVLFLYHTVGHYALEMLLLMLLGHHQLFVVVLKVLDWDLEVTALRSLAVY